MTALFWLHHTNMAVSLQHRVRCRKMYTERWSYMDSYIHAWLYILIIFFGFDYVDTYMYIKPNATWHETCWVTSVSIIYFTGLL